MFRNQIFLVLLLFIQCKYYNDDIIRIPLNEESVKCILTKNGPINYYFHSRLDDAIGFIRNRYWTSYKIENIKNLKLLDSKLYGLIYDNIGKNKDIVYLSFQEDNCLELVKHNKYICDIFYQTKYISKRIFSIGKNLQNQPFKFFGGTPKNLIEHLNKFTFNNNDKLSEVEIIFNNKSIHKINIKIEFRDDTHLICLSHDLFYEFKKVLLDKYRESEYFYDTNINELKLYDLTYEQRNIFPEIKFKIRNITISLNKKDLVYEDSFIRIQGEIRDEKIHNYLFIKNSPCDNVIFGLKLLDKFDYREYNFETNELNLYVGKYEQFIKEENKTDLKLNNYSYSGITFIILLFMVLTTTIMLLINYPKYKNIEYFNYDEI